MRILSLSFFLIICASCNTENTNSNNIAEIDLKRGQIISCGPVDGAIYGTVTFETSLTEAYKKDFNTGIALLHSFEYDESEKMFAKIIDKTPDCAMAYWGVAMSNFHPLWAPPSSEELEKGAKAVEIAKSIRSKSKRESDYIDAIGQYYKDVDKLDHRSRVLKFESAMEAIYNTYKEDREAPIFYALALNAAADPKDKTYSRQRKAFEILNPIFQQQPFHPGLAHYIIHNMDYPGLAELALPAARKYAGIAPASAHAQHMPSHIFTRLGLWDECIQSNLVSVSSAKCYAKQAGINGHWDEELHGMDYLVYAYLQEKRYDEAKQQLDYLKTITDVYPVNFKDAYAFAAIPARFALERKDWKMASELQLHPANFPWKDFPWQEAIIHYAKALGFAHLDKLSEAEKKLNTLKLLYQLLSNKKNKAIEAAHVEVQIESAEAWIEFAKGNKQKARELMMTAAAKEDALEKHPVTPGSVLPARELLGEMLLDLREYKLAEEAFEEDLRVNPNRSNGIEGLKKARGKASNS